MYRTGKLALALAFIAMTAACSNMSNTEQRALTGGAIGAAGGAGIGDSDRGQGAVVRRHIDDARGGIGKGTTTQAAAVDHKCSATRDLGLA